MCVIRALLWHVCIVSSVICSTYYIKSSEDAPCPVNYICVTMAAFTARFDQRITGNTSLIFLHGNHSLDKNLSIAGNLYLSITSINVAPTGRTTIKCHRSVRITFLSVSLVQIGEIDLINCVEIEICNVHNIIIQNVVMKQTVGILGSAMVVKWSNLRLLNSSFYNFFGTLWRNEVVKLRTNTDQTSAGGVMILSNSIVRITNCVFKNNSAELGGIIFAQNYSSVTISNSRFTDHSTTCKNRCLGGLIFLNSSNASITHSKFLRNVLNHSQPWQVTRGGVIACFDSSVLVEFGQFHINFAYMGAVIESRHSNVAFYECSFSHNSAKLNGGIGLFKTSAVFIRNCNFTGNKAFQKAGGVLYAERSTILMIYSYFNGNEAYNLGGVTRISKSNVSVTNCTFIGNGATSDVGRGGVMYFADKNFAQFCNTKFYSNRAYAGGAVSSNTGSVLYLMNNNLFIGNSAHYGGAIQVQFSLFTCNCIYAVSC